MMEPEARVMLVKRPYMVCPATRVTAFIFPAAGAAPFVEVLLEERRVKVAAVIQVIAPQVTPLTVPSILVVELI
jgi:hypothetical protein